MAFSLHKKLAEDTLHLCDLKLCRVQVMNNSRFPWLILIPMRSDLREIYELEEADRAQLMKEMSGVAQAFQKITDAKKMNVAALGNMVPQLHVHIIARYADDEAWPGTVWSGQQAPAVPYSAEARKPLFDSWRAALAPLKN